MAGQQSYAEFEKLTRDFAEKSSALGDDWKTRVFDEKVFLVKQSHKQEQGINIEYNVVFSDSYSVPVMYFRLYSTSGELIWDPDLVQSVLTRMPSNEGTFTQMPHPYLQTPFFQLHPCHTSKWMEILSKSDSESENAQNSVKRRNRSYLVSWLSFVGPVVGLHLENCYGQ